MSAPSTIQWTDVTWNPVRGCSLVSAGCANCYAMKQAHRFSGSGQPYEGLTELGPQGPRWTGKIRLVPEALEEPLHWKKPRRIFVNSMSDLFHEDVSDTFIIQVFFTMGVTPHHTYQILTKRPERMRSICSSKRMMLALTSALAQFTAQVEGASISIFHNGDGLGDGVILPNVWLGVSVEDQQTADERIPILLQTPAAVRWISAEPLLGPIDLSKWMNPAEFSSCWEKGYKPTEQDCKAVGEIAKAALRKVGKWDRLDWVVIGGESGPNARPCNVAWIRSVVEQCREAGRPCFVKQLGKYVLEGPVGRSSNTTAQNCWKPRDQKGSDPAEWPADLRVREWPR